MNYRYEQRTLGTETAPLPLLDLRIDNTRRQVKLYATATLPTTCALCGRPALRPRGIRRAQHCEPR